MTTQSPVQAGKGESASRHSGISSPLPLPYPDFETPSAVVASGNSKGSGSERVSGDEGTKKAVNCGILFKYPCGSWILVRLAVNVQCAPMVGRAVWSVGYAIPGGYVIKS